MDPPFIPVPDYQQLSGMESSSSNTNINNGKKKACGACRVRRCKCDSSCVFADVISYNEPHKYMDLRETYNIKWVEEELGQLPTFQRPFGVHRLLAKESFTALHLKSFTREGGVSDGGTKRRSQPCGACKEKKRECKASCMFAGAISYNEPEKYRKLNKVFNIKWLEKILLPLNDDQRVEVVNLFLSEADSLEEFLHSLSGGCGNHTLRDLVCPPQEVGQHNFGRIDNLLPFNQHDLLKDLEDFFGLNRE